MVKKRGQAAAAALLAIIAALIVLYILFIPPGERERILEGENQGGFEFETSINKTLLSESPGRLDFLKDKFVDHAVPSVRIFTRTEGNLLTSRGSLQPHRSVLSDVQESLEFSIKDLENLDKVLLAFNIKKAGGSLTIFLNGEVIFDRFVDTPNIEPIQLPKSLLSVNNKLRFKVSSPGLAFWRTNVYDLSDVQVVADVVATDASRGRGAFIVSSVEKKNLERVRLKFIVSCDEENRLDILINQNSIYSGIPDCSGRRLAIEIAPEFLVSGENELVFSVSEGDFTVSYIELTSELRAVDYPVYYFDLNEEQFGNVRDDTRRVSVRLNFVDVIDRKRGDLLVNGRLYGFDTSDVSEVFDISGDVVRGTNAVKVRPRGSALDVREVSVRFERKKK